MYSIMVVEDSKPIVRDIIGKIQSIRPDIKEIVVTYDGVSALDMLNWNALWSAAMAILNLPTKL